MKRLAGLVLGLSLARTAAAAGPLGADGTPIRTSQYGVDMTQTPVVAGSRVTGLSGAYVALAEGVDGNVQTPVAPAVRVGHSIDHFDYDIGFSFSYPTSLTSSDFFNTGHYRTQITDAKQQGFVFLTPALNLMWGDFGLGGTLEFQSYNLHRSDPNPAARADQVTAVFMVAHFQAAKLFARGQLAAGVGLRLLNLDVSNPNAPAAERSLFNTTGAGLELGGLVMPNDSPFRFGAAFRSTVSSEPNPKSRIQPNASGDTIIGDPTTTNAFWLPDAIRLPWDINVGAAVQLGPKPLNPEWIDPGIRNSAERKALAARQKMRRDRLDDERQRLRSEGRLTPEAEAALTAEANAEMAEDELSVDAIENETRTRLKRRVKARPRRYVLLSTSLVVTGTLKDSVGIESFLQRIVSRSGEAVTFSPRLGAETELIPMWLTVRAGSYVEPTRFSTSTPRFHGTFSFDAKVLPWSVFGLFEEDTEWKLSASIDGSARYLSWGVGLGVWH